MSGPNDPAAEPPAIKVLACIVSWNTAEHLAGAIETLLAQRTSADLEIVVVDNASADGSAELARGYGKTGRVRVVANPDNRGFAGGANQGIALARASGAQVFCVANPDVRLEPDYLQQAVTALLADDRRAAVQGKLWRTAEGPGGAPVIDTTGHLAFRTRLFRNRGEGEVDHGQHDAAGEVFGVSGALAVYRLAALDDVAVPAGADGSGAEVFDETLFAYWEDVDLDWRLQLRGWTAWYTPAATAHHERGGAGPRRSEVVERLNFTNRLLVILKDDHLPALLPALPGIAVTTVLKALELAVTAPPALLASAGAWRSVPATWRRRRHVQANATVAPAAVLARWFEPFDYVAWVRTWWRRVRRERRRAAGSVDELRRRTRGPGD